MSDQSPAAALGVRADIWLWAARFFKTRSIVKAAIEGGKIEINGAACKPAKLVRIGDHVRITRGQDRLECEVLALSDDRGPAKEAQRLYRETDASRVAREAARETRLNNGPVLRPPKRPDKKARRQIRGFRESLYD